MAQYKVPQDVEADDKLLGPFSFRQFVYLMIAGALIALAVGLFQLFPLLAIIPLPPVLLFVALALPLKKDQPMETYLAALVSYYLKPRTRVWMSGQRESTIKITAPKKVEASRTRDITGEEATHRLSFLADIVDTEGYAIKGINTANPMREDLMAEASTAVDMFEGSRFNNLASTIQKEEIERHAEVMKQMQETIDEVGTAAPVPVATEMVTETAVEMAPKVEMNSRIGLNSVDEGFAAAMAKTGYADEGAGKAELMGTGMGEKTAELTEKKPKEKKQSSVVVMPDAPAHKDEKDVEKTKKPVTAITEKKIETHKAEAEKSEKAETKESKPSIIELANNDALSVATIAKEAKRLKRKEEGEVFISLH